VKLVKRFLKLFISADRPAFKRHFWAILGKFRRLCEILGDFGLKKRFVMEHGLMSYARMRNGQGSPFMALQ
jgi:hypothetical protein